MQITIGKFNAATGTVPVTFSEGEVEHERDVNAVLGEGGAYDRKATRARVDEVALGVAAKIAAGVIRNPPPAPADPEPAE